MSWSAQNYAGGGQVFPQVQQNQQFQRTLQMMHMQMQLQHKLQIQKQQHQDFNQSANKESKPGTPQNQSNFGNKSVKNDNVTKPANQNASKNENATAGKKDTTPNSAGNQTMQGKNQKNQPQSGKGSADSVVNANKPNANASRPSPQKKDIKSEDLQKPQVNNQKGSLLGQPQPLFAGSEFPYGAKNEKYNKGQGSGKQSNYGDPKIQSNRPDNMHMKKDDNMPGNRIQNMPNTRDNNMPGNRAEKMQDNKADMMQSNRFDNNRGNRADNMQSNKQYQNESYQQGHWQNQQYSGNRPGSHNDWPNQQDMKSGNPYAESNMDYNRDRRAGAGGYDTQSNFKGNMSSYGTSADAGMKSGLSYKSFPRANRGRFATDRLQDKLESMIPSPLTELEPLDISEKKFNAFSKIFIGNIPRNVGQEEILTLFQPYGEIGPTYINKDSSFGFITMDYKANAAKAIRELDNKSFKNRYLKVRFATISEGIRVRNLSPYVSSEFLEKTFAVFGPIESCRALVDDRGNPKFEGIIIYKDKKSAALAVQKCQEECYFLSGALKPVVAVPLEPVEDCVEGFPETCVPQNDECIKEREILPHFADPTSFEFEFGSQWKKLFSMYDEKKAILDRDFQIELERLDKKMILAKVEFETDKLRKELAQREAETAHLRRHFGAEDYEFGRPGSEAGGKYAGMESSGGSYDNYGAVDQGYEGGYGGSGYDQQQQQQQQYNTGYDSMGGGGYSSTAGMANTVDDYGRGYSQTGSGYSSTYGRESYGMEGAGYGATESKFDRGNFDRSTPVDASAGDNRTSQRPSTEQPPEPPAFKKAPEPPPLPNDPYNVPNKRPRY